MMETCCCMLGAAVYPRCHSLLLGASRNVDGWDGLRAASGGDRSSLLPDVFKLYRAAFPIVGIWNPTNMRLSFYLSLSKAPAGFTTPGM